MGQFLALSVQHTDLAKSRLETQQAIQDLYLLFLGCRNRSASVTAVSSALNFAWISPLTSPAASLAVICSWLAFTSRWVCMLENICKPPEIKSDTALRVKRQWTTSRSSFAQLGLLLSSLHGSCHLIRYASE